MSRRAAIFLHAKDVDEVRKPSKTGINVNKKSPTNTKAGAEPKKRQPPPKPTRSNNLQTVTESHGSITEERSVSATPGESEIAFERQNSYKVVPQVSVDSVEYNP